MQRRLAMLTAAAALAVLAVSSARDARGQQPTQQQSQPVVLRIATLAPPGSDWDKILSKLAVDVDTKTQHRVTVTFFPGVDEKDFVQKMNLGQLDGAELTSSGLALIDPSIRVLELPAMFASDSETDYVVIKTWPLFQEIYSKAGVVLGDREELGSLALYSQSSLAALPVFAKATIRFGPGDAVLQDLYAQIGVASLDVPAAQVDAAFAAHTIDACDATPAAMASRQRSAGILYETPLPFGYRVTAIVLTKASMTAISADDQRILEHLMDRTAVLQLMTMRRVNDAAHKAMVQAGLTSVAASRELTAAFDAAAQKTQQNLVGTLYSQDLLDQVLKTRAKYRVEHPPPP